MREVVERLGRRRSRAMAELVELQQAVDQVLLASERIAITTREVAARARALERHPGLVSPGAVLQVFEHASRMSDVMDLQVGALRELRRGLEGWDIQAAVR